MMGYFIVCFKKKKQLFGVSMWCRSRVQNKFVESAQVNDNKG